MTRYIQAFSIAFFSEAPSPHAPNLSFLQEQKLPFVLLDAVPEHYAGAYVANDIFCAGRLAAKHLLSVGCQRMAFINGPSELVGHSAFLQLESGFRSVLTSRIAKRMKVLRAPLTLSGGREAFDT